MSALSATRTAASSPVRIGQNWEDDGFLEGHLVSIGDFANAVQYRVLKIDGGQMTLLGEQLATEQNVSKLFWVQGQHGGLTVLHGGGNLAVDNIGDVDRRTLSGANIMTRLDGRSWQEAGFEIGQIIQVGSEGQTRTVRGLCRCRQLSDPTTHWRIRHMGQGLGPDRQRRVLRDYQPRVGDAADPGALDVHLSTAETTVTVVQHVTLVVDVLVRAAGSWITDRLQSRPGDLHRRNSGWVHHFGREPNTTDAARCSD